MDSTPSSPFVEQPPLRLSTIDEDTLEAHLQLESELRKKISILEFKYNQLHDSTQIKQLKSEEIINDLHKKYETKCQEMESCVTDSKIVFDENKNLKTKVKELSQNLTDSNELNESVVAELETSNRRLESLTDRYKYKQSEYESNLRQLEDKLHKSIADNKSILSQFESTISLKNDKIDELSHALKLKESEINLLQSKNAKQSEIKARELYEKECASQLEYIHELESKNLQVSNKLKQYQSKNDYIEILKDEKLTLSKRLADYESLEEKYTQMKIENEQLIKEINSWKSFEGGDSVGKSPYELISNYQSLNSENTRISKQLTNVRSELTKAQEDFTLLQSKSLEASKEIDDLKNDNSTKKLEIFRLRNDIKLSGQEIQFLKDRLDNVAEENTLILQNKQILNDNESNKKNYEELVQLLNDYKSKLTELSNENEEYKSQSNKRQKTENENSHSLLVSEIQSKTTEINKLKAEVETISNKLMNTEKLLRDATYNEHKLQNIIDQNNNNDISNNNNSFRILQLKDNPTSKFEKISKLTIDKLRQENSDLLNQLNNKASNVNTVPRSVYDRISNDLQLQQAEISNLSKRLVRLRETYSRKSMLLNNVVFNLLGYKLEFINDYKLKLMSHHHYNNHQQQKEQGICYIIVDITKNGTIQMTKSSNDSNKSSSNIVVKIASINNSGGDDKKLGQVNVDNLINFWVKEKKQPSCFFSALNLELFDKCK